MTKKNRLTFKLTLLAISCIGSVTLLDIAFRAYEREYLILELPEGAQRYDLEPVGYNDHEGFLEERKRPGEYRILSFGDSFAQAVTIPRLSYSARLQERLSRASDQSVRIVNFGRGGTSFPDYHAQLSLWSERVEFDAVMLNVYAGNDFFEQSPMLTVIGKQAADQPDSVAGLRYGPGVDIPERFPLRFVDYLWAHYFSFYYAADVANQDEQYHRQALQYSDDVYMRTQQKIVAVYQPELLSSYADAHFWLYKMLLAARELERGGTPVALTLAPSHFAADAMWMDEVLAEINVEKDALDLDLPARILVAMARAVEFNGPILYLTPCLRAASDRGEDLYWGTNSHWSVHGNARVAEILAPELAARWLDDADAEQAASLGACGTEAPEPTSEVRRYLSSAVERFAALVDFEQSTITELAQNEFADEAALVEALEASGLVHAPDRIRGAFWGFLPVKRTPVRRPHGLWRVALPKGWAQDDLAPGEPVMIAFFRKGRLLGVGRTSKAPGAQARFTPGISPESPNVLFDGLISKPVPRLESVDDLWVVAFSNGKWFARLPYSLGPDALRVPGGQR